MISSDSESPYGRYEDLGQLVDVLAEEELRRTGTTYVLHSGRVDGLPTRRALDWEMAWGDFLASVYPKPATKMRASGVIYTRPYRHVTLDIWTAHGEHYDRVTIVAARVLEDGQP